MGTVSLGFMGSSSSLNILYLELRGICEGIKAAIQAGFGKVVIESDSLAAIKLLRNESNMIWSCENIVREIWSLLPFFSSFSIVHVFREANIMAADFLAKLALAEPCMHCIFVPPLSFDLDKIVIKDKQGTMYNRFEKCRLELKADDISVVLPSRKLNTFEIPSAMQNLETLWTWVNDDNVGTIKIEGESGTGKSWLVKKIVERAHASGLFDTIKWKGYVNNSIYDWDYVWELGMNQSNLVTYHENAMSKLVYVGPPLMDFNETMDKVLEVKELSEMEARLVFENQSGLQLDDAEVCEFAQPLLEKCNGNLSMILVLAASLRRNLEESSTTLGTIDILQRASDLLIDQSMPIAYVVCEMLPSKQVRGCFISFLLYISDTDRYPKDPVNVESLIYYLIWQGCLDGYNCLEDAHKRGQDILLELIDSCLLIRHDNEHVMAQSYTLFQDYDIIRKYGNPAVLDFWVGVYNNSFVMNKELEIKYCGMYNHECFLEGLLVYCNEARVPHEIPDAFFEEFQHWDLRIISLQHIGIKCLPSSLSTCKRLGSLILRDCTSLEDVNQIRELPELGFLDLSGASSLKKLPDNLFQNMGSLFHLDLSNTQLTKLPSSFYNLTKLQYLCLQGCSRLQSLQYMIFSGCLQIQTMPHPDAVSEIKVLDLSGASAFKEFQGASTETCRHFRKIDLSGTKVVDVHFLSRCVQLHELLLKNCSMIETVPCLSREVQMLDLSGSVSFNKFEDEFLGDKLLSLDLSRTQIEKLPMFSIDSRLSQLSLRECAHLEELPPSEYQKLEVLDLSGSINFKIFNDVSSVKLRRLRTLDLSATQISELPHLSECSHLQQLVLRNCPRLETLPPLKELTKLQVLDLSGSSAFMKFQENDMEKMVKLQDLNLSGTRVVRIPSLDKSSDLRTLILRGCSKFESLPQLEALSRLQVLDLSSSVSFTTFQDQSLGSKHHLEIIDLSGTQVAELPILSGCSNLSQLLLGDCSKLKYLPPLDKHTKLEVLDLSGTKNLDMSILSPCQNLRQLSLRGCSNLDAVSFECMHDLERVDLSGTSIQMLPSCFSKFMNLNLLLLKDCSNLKMLTPPDSFNNLEVLDISCEQVEESSSGISASAYSRFLVTLNKNFLWEFDFGKYSERFYFCLCSCKDWGKEKDIYLQRQEAVFRDIYYQTNHIPHVTEDVPDKFFKICGFQTYPSGSEKVLVYAELLYVENNDFMTRLSDLGAKHVNVMKECWIESCQNMESCFYGEEEEENDALGKCLQNLWVSKLSNLKCLFRDVVNSKSFACLKKLYIECCPSLITLFSSHLELKHLETLKIKFCDKLENVSGDMLLTEQTFPRLKILSLWKLPKLHRVCTGALPSLEYLAVKRCPKLEKLPFSFNSTSRSLKIKGDKQWWDNLKCEDDNIKFHISFTEFPQFL